MTAADSPILTAGLDLARDIPLLPVERIREGLCDRCGGDPAVCLEQCQRMCAFGRRFVALCRDKPPRPIPQWQRNMVDAAIARAKACQQYLNGGCDEATAISLAGYKSKSGWATARKKYAQHLVGLPPMKAKEVPLMNSTPSSVRVTQVTGRTAIFQLEEDGRLSIRSQTVDLNGEPHMEPQLLRCFLRELQEALDILTAEEATVHDP
ncbi:MAG: hypothetical protein ACI4O7_09445 [Aristaeellaceae bacterium]